MNEEQGEEREEQGVLLGDGVTLPMCGFEEAMQMLETGLFDG